MPGADAAGSNRRVEIDNTLRMYQYHAKPLRVSIASVVYGVGDSEIMLITGRTNQRSAMARHRLLFVVTLRAVIILVGLGGSAGAQRSDAVGEAWSTTSNVILFVAMAVALIGLGKLDDAYFNWLKGIMPRWLFLTISLGGFVLSLLIVGSVAWSAFLSMRPR